MKKQITRFQVQGDVYAYDQAETSGEAIRNAVAVEGGSWEELSDYLTLFIIHYTEDEFGVLVEVDRLAV